MVNWNGLDLPESYFHDDDVYIIHGDCVKVMPEMPDKSIGMVLCDLPYGTTQCKWDTVIPFDILWAMYHKLTKIGTAIVLFGSEPFSSNLRVSNLKQFKYDWIWRKSRPNGFLNSKIMPMKSHETVSVFCQTVATYNPQGLRLKAKQNRNTGVENVYGAVKKNFVQTVTYTGYPFSVIDFNNPTHPVHPTEKPIDLCEYLIKTHSTDKDIVLDNCLGSGTTAIASSKTNRKCIGIEISEEYCELSAIRYLRSLADKEEE